MDFFLPIAGVNIDLPVIFFLSFTVGILSGLFGVISTWLLIKADKYLDEIEK